MCYNYDTKDALNFLSGQGTDGNGRVIEDYFKFSPERWEACHDHIQWAFPSDIPSQFNPNAPRIVPVDLDYELAHLSAVTIAQITMNSRLLTNQYYKSVGFDTFLHREIDTTHNNIFTPDNHNFRRLTRIMRSKMLFHEELSAEQLRNYLFTRGIEAANRHSCLIHQETFRHWYNAATRNYTA